MTNNERVNRNIGLAFDFISELCKHPELLEKLPDNTNIEFIEKDFPNKAMKKSKTPNTKYILVKNEFEIQ